jgi:hypothetical protein
MHEYDTALKSILMRLNGSVLAQLTGFAVERWHNVELPAVQNRRVDLPGQALIAYAPLAHLPSVPRPEIVTALAIDIAAAKESTTLRKREKAFCGCSNVVLNPGLPTTGH